MCVIHPASDTPSTAPRQYILTMPSQNTYYCDCQRYCDGQTRVVKRSTYYNHAKYRNHPQFSAEFQEYLNANPPIFCSSAYDDMKRSRMRMSGTRGGPQAECVHLSSGDRNTERDSVGAFPRAHIRGC
jgi:hypothetical protein